MRAVFVLALVFIVCAVLVGGVVFLLVRGALRSEREREARWAAWATGLGGHVIPATGSFLFRTPASVVVPHAYAWVTIDKYVVSAGKSSTTYTRARAHFTLGFGPPFRVSAEGLLSAVGKALGGQDLLLGDPAFDARFVIKGDSPDAIRWAWVPLARQAALRLGRPSVRSTGMEITALMLGTLTPPDELGALAAMVGELASYRIGELAALANAADGALQLPTELSAPPMLRLATPRGEVVAVLGRDGLSAKMQDLRGLPALNVSIDGAAIEGGHEPLPRGLVSDDARALLARVGTCRVSARDGVVWLTWPGVPDAPTLRAGAQLLAELAGGDASRGAFR